jgi:hypothetical protein
MAGRARVRRTFCGRNLDGMRDPAYFYTRSFTGKMPAIPGVGSSGQAPVITRLPKTGFWKSWIALSR